MCGTDIFLSVLSIFFPPLGVWVKRGICGADSLINIALCCLGWLPGLLHAWYIILLNPERGDYESAADSERHGGSVTYYYVQHDPSRRMQAQPQPAPHPPAKGSGAAPAQAARGYGTVPSSSAPATSANAPQGSGAENGAGGPPPPSYTDAISGDNKVQTHN